jgi:phage/plasmid-associated DNA primase
METKDPAIKWKAYQQMAATVQDARAWFGRYEGMAVICGFGGLHGLDFDHNDDGVTHQAWRDGVERIRRGLVDRLVHETSKNGGHHYYFLCELLEIEHPHLLASLPLVPGSNNKNTALIEYKGTGRYCICAPTPGYTRVAGDLAEVPDLTAEEISVLIDIARGLNQHFKEAPGGARYTKDAGKPGTDYLQKATVAETLRLLEEYGWHEVKRRSDEDIVLERPGKNEGSTSANLQLHEGIVKFFVYTVSAPPFQNMKGYNAFQVFTLLKYGDSQEDFKEAARELRKRGYGEHKDDEEKGPPPDLVDVANEFILRYGHERSYDPETQYWRIYTGSHWKEVSNTEQLDMHTRITGLLQELQAVKLNSYGPVESTIKFAQAMGNRNFDMKQSGDTNEGLIAFENGTLELESGLFREHDPDDNLPNGLPYEYTPGADWPQIRKFLSETMVDQESQDAYAGHIGLALMRDRTQHIAIALIGGKNSGKSTLFKLANRLVGNSMDQGAPATIFSEDLEGMRSRATWNGKLLVGLEELPIKALRHEELTKSMLAHGPVSMRQMYQKEDTNNRWQPKVLFTANEEPRYGDTTGALGRRLIFISCPHERENDDPKIDRQLIHKLDAELGAYARYCLEQAKWVLAAQLYPCSLGMKQLHHNIALNGDSFKFFVEYYLESASGKFVSSEEIYQAYANCCARNLDKNPLGASTFYKRLSKEMAKRAGVRPDKPRISNREHPKQGYWGMRVLSQGEVDTKLHGVAG